MNNLYKYKKDISRFISEYLTTDEINLSGINRWGRDIINRFSDFSTKGKMLRGSLLLFSYEMFTEAFNPEILKIAAAIELLHSSLLIHDDIMDRDTFRRGNRTIFAQYMDMFNNKKEKEEAYHIGESLGICAGDIGFFISFNIIAKTELDPKIKSRIISLWSEELSFVGLAQMEDIWFSALDFENINIDDILNMYNYKTSRYSFSLPLITGGVLANQDERTLDILQSIGEDIGLIFQIKDDELGLFGDEKKTGKPIGSDLKEGKKTLYIAYILKNAIEKDRLLVKKIIGKKDITDEMIGKIKVIAESSGATKDIIGIVNSVQQKCFNRINQLQVKDKYKKTLYNLTNYVMTREL